MAKIGTAYVDVQGDYSKLNRQSKVAGSKAGGIVGKNMKKAMGAGIAAGLSVAALKNAVDSTVTLAKATAQLSRMTGMSIEDASRWSETAKVRNIDAKALNMSFITLSRSILGANKAGSAQAKMFSALGVSQENLKKGNTQGVLLEISDAFAKMPNGAQKAAIAQKLFGRQMQGLLPLINRGSDALSAQLGLSDKYGTTMDKNMVTKAIKAAAAQRELSMAFDGVKIAVATKVLPAMTTGSQAVAGFVSGLRKGNIAGHSLGISLGFVKVEAMKLWREMGIGNRDMENIKTAFSNTGKVIAAVGRRYLPAIKEQFAGTFRVIGGIVKVFASLLSGDFRGMWRGIKQIFSGAFTQLRGTFKAATAPLRAAASAMWNAIKEPTARVWRSIYATVGGFINRIVGLINKIPGVNIGKIDLGGGKKKDTTSGLQYPLVKAGGGVIGGSGLRDTVPIMAAPGEAILNRHQQRPVENALRQTYGFGLDQLFQKENRPHYMAHGGAVRGYALGGLVNFPKASSLGFGGQVGSMMTGLTKWVISKATSWVGQQFASLIGGGAKGGPKGLGSFDGLQVAKWIIPALDFARNHGWPGRLTSGFRSHAYNVAQGRNYASNHEGVQYPGGAVDVGGYGAKAQGAALNASLAGYKGRRLIWGGPVMDDWGHFSATGHARGGFVNAARGLSAMAIKKLWLGSGGAKSKAQIMTAIALAESKGDKNAHSGTDDRGLWQINWPTWAKTLHKFGSPYVASANAKMAKAVLAAQGLSAWATYNSGAYKSFMAAARRAVPKSKKKPKVKTRTTSDSGAAAASPYSSGDVPEGISDWMTMLDNKVAVGEMSQGQHDANIRDMLGRPGLNLATRAALSSDLSSGDTASGEDPNQPLIDAQLAAAEAAKAQAEALAANTAELKSNRVFAEKTHAAIGGEVHAAIYDGLFRLLGGRSSAGFGTATPRALYA